MTEDQPRFRIVPAVGLTLGTLFTGYSAHETYKSVGSYKSHDVKQSTYLGIEQGLVDAAYQLHPYITREVHGKRLLITLPTRHIEAVKGTISRVSVDADAAQVSVKPQLDSIKADIAQIAADPAIDVNPTLEKLNSVTEHVGLFIDRERDTKNNRLWDSITSGILTAGIGYITARVALEKIVSSRKRNNSRFVNFFRYRRRGYEEGAKALEQFTTEDAKQKQISQEVYFATDNIDEEIKKLLNTKFDDSE